MSYSFRVRLTLAVVVVASAWFAGRASGQADLQAPNSQPNPYQTIDDFFRLPEGRKIGSTTDR